MNLKILIQKIAGMWYGISLDIFDELNCAACDLVIVSNQLKALNVGNDEDIRPIP